MKDTASRVEMPANQFLEILGIELLGKRRRTHKVAKHHGQVTQFIVPLLQRAVRPRLRKSGPAISAKAKTVRAAEVALGTFHERLKT